MVGGRKPKSRIYVNPKKNIIGVFLGREKHPSRGFSFLVVEGGPAWGALYEALRFEGLDPAPYPHMWGRELTLKRARRVLRALRELEKAGLLARL